MARPSSTLPIVAAMLVGFGACTVFDGLTFPPAGGAQGDASPNETGATGAYESAVLADTPLAYWRFEDGSSLTAHDATGHGNDCQYVGSIHRNVPSGSAKLGIALDFVNDKSDYVRCRDAPFDFTDGASFSLEAWVNARTADDVYRKIFSKDQIGTRAGYNLVVKFESRPVLRFERWGQGTELCRVSAPLTLDAWTHVVGTFDGTNFVVYVDGNPVSSPCLAGGMSDTTVPLTFGVQSDLSYGPFDGLVDELAIYDHALAADRVLAHLAAGR